MALPGLCSFLEAPGQNPFLCLFQFLEALTLLCSNPASPGSFLSGRYLLLILSHLPLQLLRTLVIRLDPPRKSRTSFPSQGPQLNHINESDVTDSQLQGLGNRHLPRTVSLSTTHWKGRKKKRILKLLSIIQWRNCVSEAEAVSVCGIYNSSQKAALTGKIATLQEAMAPPLPDQISDGSSPGKAGAPACPF